MNELIHKSLSQLSKGQQEVFLLYYSFGKSYTEIATDLGISESAVSNRLHTGKKKLKNIMQSTMTDYLGGYDMDKEFTSKVIENIRKLYAIPSENCMFDACMCSAMIHINRNEAFDFLFFAGATGDMFTQVWLEPKWQYNDSYSHVAKYTQIPIKAAFDACGYEYEFIDKDTIQKNQKDCIKKIIDSINKGLPVLTFGIVGPPVCSIICGYDENGEVLIGWSQFTDEPKCDNPNDLINSTGQFRIRNGLDNSDALIFFKKQITIPSLDKSIRKSILNIPSCVSREKTEIFVLGQTAYFGMQAFDMWADSLLYDKFFTDEKSLESPLDTYGSCMVMVGTNMHYIQKYLQRALELCPDMKTQIGRLQQAYAKENDALQRLVDFQGGYFFDSNRKALLNKEFRIKLAEHIRDVGKCYAEAANLIY